MYRRLLILLALSGMVQAKNLGTWGEMYPIAEQQWRPVVRWPGSRKHSNSVS